MPTADKYRSAMIKLLICILAMFGLSVCLLQLRQQRLNYRYEMNHLHDKIESSQAKLWNQQLQVAVATTPEALRRQVLGHGGLPGGEVAVPGEGEEKGKAEVGKKLWLNWRGDK